MSDKPKDRWSSAFHAPFSGLSENVLWYALGFAVAVFALGHQDVGTSRWIMICIISAFAFYALNAAVGLAHRIADIDQGNDGTKFGMWLHAFMMMIIAGASMVMAVHISGLSS